MNGSTTSSKIAAPAALSDGQSAHIPAPWTKDWGSWIVVFFLALVTFHALSTVLQLGGSFQSVMSNIVSGIINLGPCILAWRIARDPSFSPRMRRGWGAIGWANLSFLIGTIIWIYFENYLGVQPFPSWADLGYLLYYPLMFIGLAFLVERFQSAEEKLSFTLDACVTFVGGALVVWYFLISVIAADNSGDWLTKALAIGYPVGDLVLFFGMTGLVLRRRRTRGSLAINLTLVSIATTFVTDVAFSYTNLIGTYQSGSIVDAGFAIGCFFILLAAHVQYRAGDTTVDQVAVPLNFRKPYYWLPYISVVAVYAVIGVHILQHDDTTMGIILAAAAGMTVMVVIRQYMVIRENVRSRAALSELQQRIQGVFSASTDAIGITDSSGVFTEVNDSFVTLTGYPQDQIVGMKYTDFVIDDDLEPTHPPDKSDTHIGENDRSLVRSDDTTRKITVNIYSVNGTSGDGARAVVIRDVTDRRALEAQLTHQAMHDALTGLANRSLLHNRVTAALSRARRRSSRAAVLFIDLDNFKSVNDTLGHAAGDELLRTVAARLSKFLRASDTPARMGGDEFAVLLEDLESDDQDANIASRILDEIRQPFLVGGKEIFVGASIGIAHADGTSTTEDVLRNADVAMYMAKKNGKNRFEIFEEQMHQTVLRRARIERELRSALEKDEFEVHYQPIFDLNSGRVAAVEALLRWNHPRGLLVGPDEFIPIAEEANLIVAIGKMVITEAFAQAARWNKKKGANIALTVNISSRQFLDDNFIPFVIASYTKVGLSPENVVLEITEGTMLSHTASTLEKLKEIREHGVRLAIDDFGTGYSSLSYLHKFPVDVLKIDRAFIEKVTEDDEGEAMARAIVSMCETLKLRTIAEGIELAEQAKVLSLMGCDWGQGYYYAVPMNAEMMQAFLEGSHSDDGGNFGPAHLFLEPSGTRSLNA